VVLDFSSADAGIASASLRQGRPTQLLAVFIRGSHLFAVPQVPQNVSVKRHSGLAERLMDGKEREAL
jgi:hypothetical protein